MTDKFENIKSEEIKLNADGEVVLSGELANAVAGGISPEGAENDSNNAGCVNLFCSEKQR